VVECPKEVKGFHINRMIGIISISIGVIVCYSCLCVGIVLFMHCSLACTAALSSMHITLLYRACISRCSIEHAYHAALSSVHISLLFKGESYSNPQMSEGENYSGLSQYSRLSSIW
jgi:hypothetical protein